MNSKVCSVGTHATQVVIATGASSKQLNCQCENEFMDIHTIMVIRIKQHTLNCFGIRLYQAYLMRTKGLVCENIYGQNKCSFNQTKYHYFYSFNDFYIEDENISFVCLSFINGAFSCFKPQYLETKTCSYICICRPVLKKK